MFAALAPVVLLWLVESSSAGIKYEHRADGGKWGYNSNSKMLVLMQSFSVRMKEMVDGLGREPETYVEWDVIKALFKTHREGLDSALEKDGSEMDANVMSEMRTKLVRQIARRSGYLIKEENVFKKVSSGKLFERLFTNVDWSGRNADGEVLVKSAKIKDPELLKKWKTYNRHQVWVLMWNLFAAVAESKINEYSPKYFHMQAAINADLEHVAKALVSYFSTKKSGFHDKDPWHLSMQSVLFSSEQDYQREWGLLSFPPQVIRRLSGEMQEEKPETDGLVNGLFSEQSAPLENVFPVRTARRPLFGAEGNKRSTVTDQKAVFEAKARAAADHKKQQ